MSSHLGKRLGWNTEKLLLIFGWRAVFAVTTGTHWDKGDNAEDFHFEKNVAMADRRKLQAEVDRCLKKVQEGVDAFEEIWQKVQSAANLNQKEKYEADLKREIKKLQRLREQIKAWVSSSDIKDKQILLDNRKLIETQMERFKVVEKETKTKAYSKEGLGAGRRLDPMEKEREEVKLWLQDCIERLGFQSEKLESELEILMNAKKKKGDKNDKADAVKTQLQRHKYHVTSLETLLRLLMNESVEVDQVKNIQEDVDYYIDSNQDPNFEENEYIYNDFDLESADTFVPKLSSENDEEGTESIEGTTEALSLNSQQNHPAADSASGLSNHSTSAPVGILRDREPAEDRKRLKSVSEEQTAWKGVPGSSGPSTSSAVQLLPVAASVTSDGPVTQQSLAGRSSAGQVTSAPPRPAVTASATVDPMSPLPVPATTVSGFAAAVAASLPVSSALPSVVPPVQQHSYSNAVSSAAAASTAGVVADNSSNPVILKGPKALQSGASTSTVQQPSAPKPQSTDALRAEDKESLSTVVASTAAMPPPSSTPSSLPSSGSSVSSVNNSAMPSPAPSPAAAALPSSAAPGSTAPVATSLESTAGNSKLTEVYQNGLVHPTGTSLAKVLSNTETIHSLRAAALEAAASICLQNANSFNPPLGSTSQSPLLPPQTTGTEMSHSPSTQSPEADASAQYLTSTIKISPLLGIAPLGQQHLTKENAYQLNMVSAAFEHMPHPSDSERLRPYISRNPCSTPSYYPQASAPQADSVEFFQRLSTETLFFVFYYMEGTKAQYLAAKALKKQSWRFHTKYLMWFQRHDEPKTITDEYEQGTYIYFDYEKWGQRRKDGFTFEYRYLEDKEL